MPRNGSGTYQLPEAPFVPQTPISSAAVNSDFSDIASALTGSLARDGQGGMTAELPLANSGFSYSSDPNTGMHRTGADAQAIECGGADIIEVDASGATVNGNLEVTGAVTSGGVAILPIGLGPLPWSGTTAPPKWLLCGGQSVLRASYPDLWAFVSSEIALGNLLFTNGDGSTTFTVPDLRGRLPAGKTNMAGVLNARLTSLTMSPDGTVLGGAGGSETNTLTLAKLPTGITVTGNVTVDSTGIDDIPRINTGSSNLQDANTSSAAPNSRVFPGLLAAGANINSQGINTLTSNNTNGEAHLNVQPTIITNYIIYAGA